MAEAADTWQLLSQIPRTSQARQNASLAEKPLKLQQLLDSAPDGAFESQTVLYLSYGSNMCAETFRDKRKIKPLSQVNVVVPELSLTFDLPGIPYLEPCIGNVRYRDVSGTTGKEIVEKDTCPSTALDYHKDRWPKGLVGVVYEVSIADYVHIIATEGGGVSYKDVIVSCYALPSDPNLPVPTTPSGTPFKAYTFFSPPSVVRPIHSYAQPSPRYLKLITDGAAEHDLPFDYQAFLNDIGTYRPTTTRQRLGQFIFLGTWGPIFAFLFGGPAAFLLDKDGRYPKWFARLVMAVFVACWRSYDDIFKRIFGDGERTIQKEDQETSGRDGWNEKD
jgi:hypothetical protein